MQVLHGLHAVCMGSPLAHGAGGIRKQHHLLRPHSATARCAPPLSRSYRGYGLSKGKPSQQGIQKDARAFLQHLLGRTDIDTKRIVLMGRSLGGAVAIHLAAEQQDKVRLGSGYGAHAQHRVVLPRAHAPPSLRAF